MRFVRLVLRMVVVLRTVVAAAAFVACGAIETLYRVGLTYAGELPRPPPVERTDRIHVTLWAAEEGRAKLELQPIWAWTLAYDFASIVVRHRIVPARPGASLARYAARLHLWERQRQGQQLRRLRWIVATQSLAMWMSRNWSAHEVTEFVARATDLDHLASHWFGAELTQLTWAQAALLAARVQSPSGFHPVCRPVAASARRTWVLRRLQKDGAISRAELESSLAEPLLTRDAVCPPKPVVVDGHE